MRERGRQEQAFRPHRAHQRCADDRPDHGAEAVKHEQAARDLDEILWLGVVVGMRDGKRIERVGESAVGGGHGDDEGARARRDEEDQHADDGAGERSADQHVAAVGLVGEAADRHLQRCARDDDEAHHQRDLGGGDADARAIDRAERAPGAVGDADQQTGSGRDGRGGVEALEVERNVLKRLRMRSGRDRCRQAATGRRRCR